jgi:ribose transport system substrate-binding protein
VNTGDRPLGRRRWAPTLAAIVALSAVAVGCGSSDDTSSSATEAAAPSTQSAPADTTAADATASAPASWPTEAEEVEKSGSFDDIDFCGDKPIKLGVLDGIGNNPWSVASIAAVRAEAAKCPNVTQTVAIARGDLQKANGDIASMAAQGADAIVVIPDFGQAQLPALKAATAAGVKVVPWGADASGVDGTDFVSYVDWNSPEAGTLWAEWMVKALNGKGNVVFLGGPAGNPVTAGQLKSIVEVFKKNPGMKLLTGDNEWAVTNWDPATAQKVMSALLAKYPQIDGMINDYGDAAVAATRAFDAANRPLIPIATIDTNGLACIYEKQHASQPDFQVATISSRNWLGRVAARKAIAAAAGLPNEEPSRYSLPLYEDTLAGKDPKCIDGAAADLATSNQLTPEDLAKYGKID